ncbi:aromatic ring-hydroxylating dioxygenase subunit alpha [Enhygromyxa salina]|nr:aromatic ring-hydroxylating dioxygenase subunit alpha [Enhygromyxa salina]
MTKHIKNSWYVASWSKDLGVSEPFAITILNQPLVLWRTPDGVVRVLEDRCMHRFAPLSLGRCEGDRLRCRYHGIVFNTEGVAVEIPGQDEIPERACVRAYPAVERHGWVWVWMGDRDRANPESIPHVTDLDTPEFHLGAHEFDMNAEATLVLDNLLDFSHIPFLHADSFGISRAWATTHPEMVVLEDGVEYRRWVVDEELVPGSEELVDVWSVFSARVPGIITMWNGYYPLGTAKACDFGPPPPDLPGGRNINVTSQAVTPMTDRTTRYFFSWGPRKDCGDETIRDYLMAMAAKAFGEDKVMVEAQQAMIDAAPDLRMLTITADSGQQLYHRILDEHMREAGER